MNQELKPCPFCGGKAVLLGGPQAQECHSVWCLECSAKMQGGMQSEPLVEKWNARPAPAVQVPDDTVAYWRARAAEHAASDNPEYQEYAAGITDVLNALAPAPAPATVTCSYPDCNCPFDAPADPDWCARGLPKKAPATVATTSSLYGPGSASSPAAAHMLATGAFPATVATEAVAQRGGVDVEKVMALVQEFGEQCEATGYLDRSGSQDAAKRLHDAAYQTAVKIRALLSASPAGVGGVDYHAVAQFLYGLLDDIDTANDMAKSDDSLYRKIVERTQAVKNEAVAECDGYTVTFKTPAIANQEPQDGR